MESFNQYAFRLIFMWSRRNFFLDWFGVFLANYLPYLIVLWFLIWAFYRKDKRMRILVFADGALAVILARGIVTQAIRFFYHHLRPFQVLSFTPLIPESSYSFPSGHAAWFFALAMAVYFYNRRMGIWYFILAALIGIARIFVGVHWPLDIMGGAAAGVVCAMLTHRLVKPYLEKISTPPQISTPA